MRDNLSFHKRSEDQVVSSIAIEAKDIVQKAAGHSAGQTIGRQLRNACRALGYSDGNWRVRAAWYSEAGSWSAAALEDLRARYRTMEERQARIAAEIDKKHAALLRASATSLEATHEAKDREDARKLRAHAQQLVEARPGPEHV